jgi:hypothetical protein
MDKLVYRFEEGGRDQKDLLDGKRANLAEKTRLGLPDPAGVHPPPRRPRSSLTSTTPTPTPTPGGSSPLPPGRS